ncbi:MAG: DUF839 domain-containing protein [Rhodothermales bacterium]|nr:DUF839 domain-containing protein [Rhodothermales bacterium]
MNLHREMKEMTTSRRSFLKTALTATACSPLIRLPFTGGVWSSNDRFGPLETDPEGLLDLPRAFRRQWISRAGQGMSDGLHAPMFPAGIGVLSETDNEIVLACNHRVDPGTPSRTGPFGFKDSRLTDEIRARLYDLGPNGKPSRGGVTIIRVDRRARVAVEHHLALAGLLSCAYGAVTPWGSWLCAEQSLQEPTERYARHHGFAFEVGAGGASLQDAEPLVALGRLSRGGLAVHPETGFVYFSDDEPGGHLYRFVPSSPDALGSGSIQVLQLVDDDFKGGRATWVDLKIGPDHLVRSAAMPGTQLGRGVGMCWYAGDLYFGLRRASGRSEIWRLADEPPGPQIEPWLIADGLDEVRPLTGSPWGDLLIAAFDGHNAVVNGVTMSREMYPIAREVLATGIPVGACFSRDGKTLFFNSIARGHTLMISGPWDN